VPELPDVETFRRYLGSTAPHARIGDVAGLDEDMLGNVGAAELRRTLRGTLDETRRHGKWLLVRIGGAGWLVLHFGMTGDLKYSKDGGGGWPSETTGRGSTASIPAGGGRSQSWRCSQLALR
jgi:formamidopyrimidine-DNA glycosylase